MSVIKSFLIIQTAFFGDVILATGLVEQLSHAFPVSRIDMVVRKGREVLLENNDKISRIYVLDKERKLSSIFRLIRTFRRVRYDKVINVHRHGSSGLLTLFSGGRETIGFDAHPLSRFFNTRVKHERTGKHEIERNASLLAHFVEASGHKPKLYPSQADFDAVAFDGPYITISPASVWETKRWPIGKWTELISKFQPDVAVFLLGGPNDKSLCESIAKSCDRQVFMKAGQFSFLQSAALMAGAKMNYTNDSAPVHMASAMNAPVAAIFCSTIPAFGYGPLSDRQFVIEYEGQLTCRPCGIHGKKACPEGHFNCAKIDVSHVFSTTYGESS